MPNGGTPAGTASPASSSSLLNRLQLDDDIDGEARDLFVTVDDPKKHVCTMETYITYRITTKVGLVSECRGSDMCFCVWSVDTGQAHLEEGSPIKEMPL